MTKIADLQKRRERVEKELEKATCAYKKQAALIKTKQATLEQIDMEIISHLLVTKGMNMDDLVTLLGQSSTTDVPTEGTALP